MKIIFFIDELNSGGAARLVSLIANGLATRGNEVLIAADYNRGVSYTLDSSIKRLDWYPSDYYKQPMLMRVCRLIKIGRNILKKERPDIAISAISYISFLSKICGIGLGIPFVFSDQTSYARKDNPFIHFIRWHFYKLGDAVTVLTENDIKILGKHLPRKVVINNPLTYPIYREENQRKKIVLVIGHTDRWKVKGLDLIIESWGLISRSHPDWSLLLVGGEFENTKELLLRIIDKLEVRDTVVFGGFRNDMDVLMRECSILALSSRIEGFSLSLTESLSQGLPAVVYRMQGVMEDVTENGKGVILVDDGNTTAFAKALEQMMNDEDLRKRKAKEGKDLVQRYSLDRILDKWEGLLSSIIQKKKIK